MASILGLNAKLYYLSTGTRAAWPASGPPANLTLITNVTDVNVPMSASEADATTRASNGFRIIEPAIIDASITFNMVWDSEDAGFDLIQGAFFARTVVAIAAMDQTAATIGAQGLWADMKVLGFEKVEALEDVQRASVTLRPSYSAVPTAWVFTGA